MNILILTSPEHKDFISEVVGKSRNHSTYTYWQASRFEFVQSWGYDIGISYMYQYKVPKKQLNKTWINFHPGLLPEYKGRNLCYHAIMNGAKSFGATAHYMDENFDTGCIIETFDFPVDHSWTAQDLHDKTMEASKLLFERLFPLILTREKFGCTANEGGTYYKKEPIRDDIDLDDLSDPVSNDYFLRWIRAVTYGDFYPKIDIGGATYKIVRDE